MDERIESDTFNLFIYFFLIEKALMQKRGGSCLYTHTMNACVIIRVFIEGKTYLFSLFLYNTFQSIVGRLSVTFSIGFSYSGKTGNLLFIYLFLNLFIYKEEEKRTRNKCQDRFPAHLISNKSISLLRVLVLFFSVLWRDICVCVEKVLEFVAAIL